LDMMCSLAYVGWDKTCFGVVKPRLVLWGATGTCQNDGTKQGEKE